MDWLNKYPERFVRECAELDKLSREVDWLTISWAILPDSLALEVQIDMVVHGRVYEARMGYPAIFPNAPLYIRPRDPSERWSNHQFGTGGSLCLQWRADNWHPEITGADIIRSAYELLHTENTPVEPGVVPSVHALTEGQSSRNIYFRSIVTKDALSIIEKLEPQSKVELKLNSLFGEGGQVDFITSFKAADDSTYVVNDIPVGITGFSSLFNIDGKGWLLKSDAFDSVDEISSVEDLLRVIAEAGLDNSDIAVINETTQKYEKRTIVLYGNKTGQVNQFAIVSYSESPLKQFKVILPPPADEMRLPPDHQNLTGLKVGIVGLGSMGSKIAISLARSGIRKFVIVDDDFLKLENLVRHDLSWAEVGLHKVDAIKRALNLISPNLEIEALNHRVAGQEPPIKAANALQTLSQCDLLIDATANPEVFLHIAAIAHAHKIPMCWGEVYAGGYGGLIARARPDIDPNPIAVRDSFYTYLSELPPAPFKQAHGYDVQADAETPAIAYDSNVSLIAMSLTSLIIDTLLQVKPSEYPVPVYLIGMKKEWIFTQPFDTRPIAIQGEGWKDVAEPSSDASLAAVKLLLDKLSESSSAKPDSNS
ncbi:ThiF family adenylyltransferase [Methylophilus luteus]|uniref:ThiF family adenylyltransferase n=1 Tax=Methylophilus luteus TaxID=640108 RepID=A0ABW3F5A7_9PROT